MESANTIVAIGTSAGGVSALKKLVSGFDRNWAVSVFITVHIGKNYSTLPDILNGGRSQLPVVFAEQGAEFGRGIYVAPSDRHLIVGTKKTFLSEGPRENHTRPAIDPMFRSVARNHGTRAIGILLTGYLYDGVNGIHDIQAAGGCTIVQHPTDAEVPEIPMNALRRLKPDYVLPLSEIPAAIAQVLRATPVRSLRGG